MPDAFEYDVFLSHSGKDKPTVRELAERLERDGLRVWFDEWVIEPGDLIPLAIEDGLECSQTLILFMSKNAVASEWVALERHTALFRDPTNKQRRFVPLRLDDANIKDSLRQFNYVDWRNKDESEYARLFHRLKSGTSPDDRQEVNKSQAYLKNLKDMVVARLPEQFQVEDFVNFHGSAVTFKAYDTLLDRYVAIKTPNIRPNHVSEDVASFCRKMQQVSQLKHPNIMSVYAGILRDGLPMLIREYVPGVTLRELIEKTGPQPLWKVCEFLKSIGSAINYAHKRQCIHHRLSPDRILINEEGEPVVPPFRILFGGTKVVNPNLLKYAAPERFFAERVAPQASDQYGLGLIAYEMTVGKPFIAAEPHSDEFRSEKETFSESLPERDKRGRDCPDVFWKVVERLLHRVPEDRYRTIDEMLAEVDKVHATSRPRPKSKLATCVREAQESYERCRLERGFFSSFYAQLFEDKKIKELFDRYRGKKPLEEQYWILREAIDLLLHYPLERRTSKESLLKKIKESHREMGVSPNMYDAFKNALIDTILQKDEQCADRNKAMVIEQNWKEAIAPALKELKSS